MRLLLVSVALVSACGPSMMDVERHNREENAAADQRIAGLGPPLAPAPVELAPSAPVVAAAGAAGLEPGETLYRDGEQLVFASTACAQKGRCGDCAIPVRYAFHRAGDGHVVIARDRIRQRIVKTVRDSTCTALCAGGAAPPPPPAHPTIAGTGLGVGGVDAIEIRDVTRELWLVDRICTNYQPIP